MSEVVEQVAIHKSPLDEAHVKAGAMMKELDGWLVPASYGDVASEYLAVREGGAGLIDLSSRGRMEVSGTEALMFLNGLVTNDMKTLAENSWMPAAFPNVQGRLLASVRVINRGKAYLLDTETATRAAVMKILARFTMAGDFHLTDVTQETALISVQGARAAEIVRATFGLEAANVERGCLLEMSWKGESINIIRATHTAEDGFDIFTGASAAASVWEALSQAGAQPVGFDALEILRIEAGIPLYGMDVDETKVVLETGLDEAVSFTKGCYIGQEIIARIHFRGHVAKRLAGLLLEQGAEAHRDDKIRATDGKEIGWITSVTRSPRLNRALALGYVRYDYLQPGTTVRIIEGEVEREAHVAELPFVRGGWYSESA